ncbi:type II toxin-antitoxin system MqsA family antitoxin [Mesorhizobium australicum]|uniref:Type II toxin-antitoxin system MqsA family antitoxin n=1 Tax=Mesorhizobium australicum TaxID=536018 RepID=A0ACC6T6R9_9HYPH
MAAVHAALRALKEKIDGGPAPSTIRRIRTKLKLSQREAGSLFKVGENAFDKYERGLIEPSGPTIQLMTLLETSRTARRIAVAAQVAYFTAPVANGD